MFYRCAFRLLLSRLDAETAHHLSFAALRMVLALPVVRGLVRAMLRPGDEALRVRALGLDLPSPVGLAAGFDKDARGPEALGALGFGFVEIGTVTARAQPGNPRPRLFRLVEDRALLNRLGFNNDGADAVAARLSRARARRRTAVGVNVGKTKVVAEEHAIADYVESAKKLARLADYLVVNVSSPNTPGLRDLQAVGKLRPLLTAVRGALDEVSPDRRVPLLVKIAPDLSDEDIDAVATLALELRLDGIVATNTTVRRDGLRTEASRVAALGPGGISGRPLRDRSLAVLRRLRARVGERLVLVSVGGVETADDAWERIRAGATLIQLYTGFVYGGPLTARRIATGLAERARAAGFTRVQEAVGVEGLAGGSGAHRPDGAASGEAPPAY
jgi:dihydroorotate dehydrogenase